MPSTSLDAAVFLICLAFLSGFALRVPLGGLARRWYQRCFQPVSLRELPASVRHCLRR